MKKSTYKKGVSPIGIIVYANLNRPDPDYGNYSAVVRFNRHDKGVSEMMEFLDSEHSMIVSQAKEDRGAKFDRIDVYPPYKPSEDKQGQLIPDHIDVRFKLKEAFEIDGETIKTEVRLLDAKGNKVTDTIYSGSEVKVAYLTIPYSTPKAVGLRLSIRGVQVIQLNQPNLLGSLGFVQEDGYEAQEADVKVEENEKTAEAEGFEDF